MFRGGELSRAMTAWAIAGTLGVPFGSVVGGAVTAMFGWRGIFVTRHRDTTAAVAVISRKHNPHD